ncbi:MAG: phenylalanine--tRNA ligase subunit beta [Gammaproteobacteria bacterium]|nr:phenylalanine--tRNA ligase subunit beta [Gammaproteobacteria bacterium]
MKLSESWLRSWCNPDISRAQLLEQLTMSGHEVESVTAVAGLFSGVVVGEISAITPHPDADKLRICTVSAGGDTALTIVCGAANAAVGMRVPTALVGAELPNLKIKQSKLRGVTSMGMLCSASELGLAESASGLMALPDDAPIGMDVRELLQLDDVTIELGLTPNRGDCLSVCGVAREVAAVTSAPLQREAITTIPATVATTFPVSINESAACPRYLGRVINNINSQAATPLWMQERLRRSGIRALGPLVDVTNYVMLELGQPMHAFDLDRLEGGITVRSASAGEKLALLNESEITLKEGSLVIADAAGPLALAGIMGGERSGISAATAHLFLECATFSPDALAGEARYYGLSTDASHRYERGVAPNLPPLAMERATALLLAICGGQAGPVVTVGEAAPQPAAIALRQQRLEQILGVSFAPEWVTAVLARLELQVVYAHGIWQATPPAHRFDLAIEEDLIEEVARIYGYQKIPVRPLRSAQKMVATPEAKLSRSTLRQHLINQGYQEIISYSFVDPLLQQQIDKVNQPVALANPISADLSVMRTTLWCGLIQAAQYNLNRQQQRIRLFETGLRFIRDPAGSLLQEEMLAGLICGSVRPEQWGETLQQADFFALKGDVELLLAHLGRQTKVRFQPATLASLHPGQSAVIMAEDHLLGYLGALHPQLAQALDLPENSYLFELKIQPLLLGVVPRFAEISRFPALRRDIALVLDSAISSETVVNCIQEAVNALAVDFQVTQNLFDLYQGEHMAHGRKSIALGLTLQSQSRTLTEEEIEHAVTQIITYASRELGAALRGE